MHYCYMLFSYIYSHVLSYSSKFALLCSPIVFICNVVRVRNPIFNCPLIWFATINRTSHLVLYQILKIQCLWWHSPNMTACIFSLYILHFVEHIYRLPFYHLLYDIDFTCHHIAVPMLWCDARGCDTATCCCDTATCYIQIHILLANSS